MAVTAVAAAVNHPVLRPFGDFERPGFIFIQRPEVVFFVEVGFTARRLIRLEFFIAEGQQFSVLLGRHAGVLFLAGGAVAGKGKHIHAVFYHSVYDVRDFLDVCSRYGGHNHAADTGVFDAGDFFKSAVKRTGLTKPVMCFTHTIQRELVFLTAIGF